jgi:hypothetical protein
MDFRLRVDKSRIIAMSSHEPSQFNSNEWKVDNFYQVSPIQGTLTEGQGSVQLTSSLR